MAGRVTTKRTAATGAACIALVGLWEGCQTVAYPDPATKGYPWTICYGETAGVKPGDQRSMASCKLGLAMGLDGYGQRVEKCTKDLTDGAYIAFTSLSWNIGTTAFCKSTVNRLWNEGKHKEACDAMLKWNRAAGVVMRGLTRRREAEREWCLK